MTETTVIAQRRARRVLLLIGGIPVAMMLSATALWWGVQGGYVDVLGQVGTANHGSLVTPPRSVEGVTFRHEGVADTLWQDLPKKWRMVIVQRGSVCNAQCQSQLYQTRQIHIALGKDFNRVARVVLSDTSPADVAMARGSDARAGVEAAPQLTTWLDLEHKGVTALTLSAPALDNLSPESKQAPNQWDLVDPAGWIMMRFADDLNYKDVISDLRFLLKNSGG